MSGGAPANIVQAVLIAIFVHVLLSKDVLHQIGNLLLEGDALPLEACPWLLSV